MISALAIIKLSIFLYWKHSLRFVIAHKSGIVEFCHIKNARGPRKRANSLPNDNEGAGHVIEREMEISRVVVVSNQPILWMEIALNKVFVASDQGLVKVRMPLKCSFVIILIMLYADI